MEEVLLSRWQFAITTIYHFLFVPVTLGMAIFVAMLETCYVNTKRPEWKKTCRKLLHFFSSISQWVSLPVWCRNSSSA